MAIQYFNQLPRTIPGDPRIIPNQSPSRQTPFFNQIGSGGMGGATSPVFEDQTSRRSPPASPRDQVLAGSQGTQNSRRTVFDTTDVATDPRRNQRFTTTGRGGRQSAADPRAAFAQRRGQTTPPVQSTQLPMGRRDTGPVSATPDLPLERRPRPNEGRSLPDSRSNRPTSRRDTRRPVFDTMSQRERILLEMLNPTP